MTNAGKKKPYRQRHRNPPRPAHILPPCPPLHQQQMQPAGPIFESVRGSVTQHRATVLHAQKITAGKSPETVIAGGKGIIVADDPDSVDPLG
ncbi:hypothetical protein [Herbaspirillum seropedicae]|uniref:hypothetical protein n=1 Tax=Herbaspirillum seropedicae TaxID=964 RepID=UPI003FCE013E